MMEIKARSTGLAYAYAAKRAFQIPIHPFSEAIVQEVK